MDRVPPPSFDNLPLKRKDYCMAQAETLTLVSYRATLHRLHMHDFFSNLESQSNVRTRAGNCDGMPGPSPANVRTREKRRIVVP